VEKQKGDAQCGIIEVFDQKYFLDKRKAAPSGTIVRQDASAQRKRKRNRDALDDVRGYSRFPISDQQ
jgi:hypothetical protein